MKGEREGGAQRRSSLNNTGVRDPALPAARKSLYPLTYSDPLVKIKKEETGRPRFRWMRNVKIDPTEMSYAGYDEMKSLWKRQQTIRLYGNIILTDNCHSSLPVSLLDI
jgi:hypothetical protein